MDNLQEWNNIKQQMDKMTRQYDANIRSEINDMFFKKTTEIMREQTLSLIYDSYGNQLYEKTSDIQNYIKVQKSGFLTSIIIDDSKLIETETGIDDYNTDFLNYGSFTNLEKENIKHDLHIRTDFNEQNNYLYKVQEQKNRKEQTVKDGIDKIKIWFNSDGVKSIQQNSFSLNKNRQSKQNTDNSFMGILK